MTWLDYLLLLSDSGPDERPFDGSDFTSKIFPNGIIDFVVQLLGFVVLLAIVFFIAYKPVHKLIAKRREYIETNLRESERKLSEAKQAAEMKQQTIEEGRQEALRLVEEGRKQAEKEASESREALQREIEGKRQRADEEIELARKKAAKQIKQEAIDMAISASGQLLSRSVDSADERKMLDEFLDKLEEKA